MEPIVNTNHDKQGIRFSSREQTLIRYCTDYNGRARKRRRTGGRYTVVGTFSILPSDSDEIGEQHRGSKVLTAVR